MSKNLVEKIALMEGASRAIGPARRIGTITLGAVETADAGALGAK